MTSTDVVIRATRWRDAGTTRNATIVGVVGFVLCVVGVITEPRQAFASYLFAYVTVLTIVLGALIQVMTSHVTGARWFTVLRRLTLVVSASLPALAVMLLPILVSVHTLYPWAHPWTLSPEAQKLAMHRERWFNVPFFVVRAVIYVIVFAACGEMLRRWATQEDDMANAASVVATLQRQRRLSALGLVLVGLGLTFVAFDWLMPLDPLWYSTVYGVYVFAGGFVAALGLLAFVAYISVRGGGALSGTVTADHFGALGKLMLTFVIFWAYIAFSQFLIIWIGDIPADSSWYVIRAAGSWGTLGIVVVIGQFAIPFILLLSRALKRRPAVLGAIGAWLVIMHILDVYWLVLPAFHPAGVHASWLDVAALLMVGGFATAAAAWRARGHLSLPVRDPYLGESVRYVEP
ncbi:MAG TPA: hypothetical protein VII66_06630 [Gemmatimonadaceae bacterium]